MSNAQRQRMMLQQQQQQQQAQQAQQAQQGQQTGMVSAGLCMVKEMCTIKLQ